MKSWQVNSKCSSSFLIYLELSRNAKIIDEQINAQIQHTSATTSYSPPPNNFLLPPRVLWSVFQTQTKAAMCIQRAWRKYRQKLPPVQAIINKKHQLPFHFLLKEAKQPKQKLCAVKRCDAVPVINNDNLSIVTLLMRDFIPMQKTKPGTLSTEVVQPQNTASLASQPLANKRELQPAELHSQTAQHTKVQLDTSQQQSAFVPLQEYPGTKKGNHHGISSATAQVKQLPHGQLPEVKLPYTASELMQQLKAELAHLDIVEQSSQQVCILFATSYLIFKVDTLRNAHEKDAASAQSLAVLRLEKQLSQKPSTKQAQALSKETQTVFSNTDISDVNDDDFTNVEDSQQSSPNHSFHKSEMEDEQNSQSQPESEQYAIQTQKPTDHSVSEDNESDFDVFSSKESSVPSEHIAENLAISESIKSDFEPVTASKDSTEPQEQLEKNSSSEKMSYDFEAISSSQDLSEPKEQLELSNSIPTSQEQEVVRIDNNDSDSMKEEIQNATSGTDDEPGNGESSLQITCTQEIPDESFPIPQHEEHEQTSSQEDIAEDSAVQTGTEQSKSSDKIESDFEAISTSQEPADQQSQEAHSATSEKIESDFEEVSASQESPEPQEQLESGSLSPSQVPQQGISEDIKTDGNDSVSKDSSDIKEESKEFSDCKEETPPGGGDVSNFQASSLQDDIEEDPAVQVATDHSTSETIESDFEAVSSSRESVQPQEQLNDFDSMKDEIQDNSYAPQQEDDQQNIQPTGEIEEDLATAELSATSEKIESDFEAVTSSQEEPQEPESDFAVEKIENDFEALSSQESSEPQEQLQSDPSSASQTSPEGISECIHVDEDPDPTQDDIQDVVEQSGSDFSEQVTPPQDTSFLSHDAEQQEAQLKDQPKDDTAIQAATENSSSSDKIESDFETVSVSQESNNQQPEEPGHATSPEQIESDFEALSSSQEQSEHSAVECTQEESENFQANSSDPNSILPVNNEQNSTSQFSVTDADFEKFSDSEPEKSKETANFQSPTSGDIDTMSASDAELVCALIFDSLLAESLDTTIAVIEMANSELPKSQEAEPTSPVLLSSVTPKRLPRVSGTTLDDPSLPYEEQLLMIRRSLEGDSTKLDTSPSGIKRVTDPLLGKSLAKCQSKGLVKLSELSPPTQEEFNKLAQRYNTSRRSVSDLQQHMYAHAYRHLVSCICFTWLIFFRHLMR